MSPQRTHRQKSLSSSSTESSTSSSTFISFFPPEDKNFMEDNNFTAVQQVPRFQTSSSSTSNNRQRRSFRRHQRHRAITLLPGSIYHDVFFSSDDSIRENFDEQAEYDKCVNNRNLSFTRHDSRSYSATMFGGAVKSGRPLLPRYGAF